MTTSPPPAPRPLVLRVLRVLGRVLLWTVLSLWTLWATGAIYYDLPVSWPRGVLAGLFATGAIAAVALLRRHRRLVLAGACALVTLGWSLESPSNDRDWQPNVAVTAYADIDGDTVTVHNVRDCDYRTEQDYTPVFRDRIVHLSKITRADLFLCYWGSPWLAHPFVSFQFEDADPIAFSVETRMEKGEAYSTFGGLYHNYELIYVVAEERDLVRLRTTFRKGEDVYLFRIRVQPERARRLFLDYLGSVNDLHEHARWYNVLTNNCTTNIRTHTVATAEHPRPWDWRILLPGKLDELIEINHGFVSDLPLAELKPKCHLNAAANRIGAGRDFSKQIREGVPGFDGQ